MGGYHPTQALGFLVVVAIARGRAYVYLLEKHFLDGSGLPLGTIVRIVPVIPVGTAMIAQTKTSFGSGFVLPVRSLRLPPLRLALPPLRRKTQLVA